MLSSHFQEEGEKAVQRWSRQGEVEQWLVWQIIQVVVNFLDHRGVIWDKTKKGGMVSFG